MISRRFVQLEKPDSAKRAALTGQMLASPNLPLLAGKSRIPAHDGLTALGKTQRATAHLPTVFDHLYCQLEHLYVQTSAPPARRRTLAVSWVETDELLLDINVNPFATRKSSSAKETSATEHTSSPAAAAFSHARHGIAESNPATESTWSQGHFNHSPDTEHLLKNTNHLNLKQK